MRSNVDFSSQEAERAREELRTKLSKLTPDEYVFNLFRRTLRRRATPAQVAKQKPRETDATT